tara:strand:+ start:3549 stop:4544 length:996 start_codon:yes stop_codon:yes gene_type:complete
MLNIEQFDSKFKGLASSPEFKQLQKLYNDATHVFFFGHGGNMAIAEHAAIDAARLTDKNVLAPGGGVLCTSIQSDTNFNDWLMHWLDISTRGLDKSKCLAIGISCSTTGKSSDCLSTALNWASYNGINSCLWAAQAKEGGINDEVLQIIQNAKYYHTSELLSLALTYELIDGAGHKCPTISKKAKERRFESLGIESEVEEEIVTFDQQVPPGLENELNTVAVDFDGVIHTFDKGWHDGTCYGEPIEGSLDALKELSKVYRIVIFTAKVKPDRPLVNGKTGTELVDEWLTKHGVRDIVEEVTCEKPRADYYIDDKAIEFTGNWDSILTRLKK